MTPDGQLRLRRPVDVYVGPVHHGSIGPGDVDAGPRLLAHQLRVHAVGGHQLRVAPRLGDAALVQHEDAVGVGHAR